MSLYSRVTFRVERANVPYHVLTFTRQWKDIPPILDRVRALNLDVRKALITPESSTIFLKESGNASLTLDKQKQLEEALYNSQTVSIDDVNIEYQKSIELPNDTQILLYNIPSLPFTICEFSCNDRIGLLSDSLAFLSSLPVEICLGHVSTVAGKAHNIFHLVSTNGAPLDEQDVIYLSNVFEYEGKQNPVRYITPLY